VAQRRFAEPPTHPSPPPHPVLQINQIPQISVQTRAQGWRPHPKNPPFSSRKKKFFKKSREKFGSLDLRRYLCAVIQFKMRVHDKSTIYFSDLTSSREKIFGNTQEGSILPTTIHFYPWFKTNSNRSVTACQSSIPACQSSIPTYQSLIPTYQSLIPAYQSLIPAYQSLIPTYQSLIPTYHGLIPAYHGLIPAYHGQKTCCESRESAIIYPQQGVEVNPQLLTIKRTAYA
jgi:hypothetical protein